MAVLCDRTPQYDSFFSHIPTQSQCIWRRFALSARREPPVFRSVQLFWFSAARMLRTFSTRDWGEIIAEYIVPELIDGRSQPNEEHRLT